MLTTILQKDSRDSGPHYLNQFKNTYNYEYLKIILGLNEPDKSIKIKIKYKRADPNFEPTQLSGSSSYISASKV